MLINPFFSVIIGAIMLVGGALSLIMSKGAAPQGPQGQDMEGFNFVKWISLFMMASGVWHMWSAWLLFKGV